MNPFLALEPLADSLLVKPITNPTMSTGGLHLPDTSTETFSRGVVERCGPKVETVQPGDLVLFGKYAGTWVTLTNQDRLAMREVEVFLRVPAGQFAIVEHPESKHAHLAGEPCDVCNPTPTISGAAEPLTGSTSTEDADALARLRALRETLKQGVS